ncbi:MAG: Ig-like domain-containing protein [Clostridium sp.]|nr:Ig-like domain-containing protein [Clostridium sp.]
MNKTLRFSFLGLVAAVCSFVSAQTTVKFDFTGEEAYGMTLLSGSTQDYNPDPYTLKEGDVTIQLNGGTRWWKATKNNELRFYKNSSMDIAAPAGSVVTNVTLTAAAPANFTAETGTYDNGEWTGAQEKVNIACTITKSNTAITAIEVTYQTADAPVKKAPKLAFSETTVNTNLGAEFTAPELTKETTAEVVYSSSDEAVATVDAATGVVTLVATGTTVITATAAENEEYSAGSASYTLNVADAIRTEVNEPYEETFENGLGSFTINNVMLSEGLNYVWSHDSKYQYAKAAAYVNKTNYAAESWLVSPYIVLSSAEVVRTLSFDHCISKFFGNVEEEATLWIKEKDGDWKQVEITYPEFPEGKNFSEFGTQNISLAGYEGKTIQVGFKYMSTTEGAGTWEIKNFKVTAGEGGNSISEVKADAKEDNAIYNLAGQRLEKAQKGINIRNGKKYVVK